MHAHRFVHEPDSLSPDDCHGTSVNEMSWEKKTWPEKEGVEKQTDAKRCVAGACPAVVEGMLAMVASSPQKATSRRVVKKVLR